MVRTVDPTEALGASSLNLELNGPEAGPETPGSLTLRNPSTDRLGHSTLPSLDRVLSLTMCARSEFSCEDKPSQCDGQLLSLR